MEEELNTLQTETLFHTYSQFGSVPNIPAKPSEDERQTELKIQDLLEKVRHTRHAMSWLH